MNLHSLTFEENSLSCRSADRSIWSFNLPRRGIIPNAAKGFGAMPFSSRIRRLLLGKALGNLHGQDVAS